MLLPKKILTSGILGALASAAAAAVASRVENGHAARPMNAIVHIYDGGEPPQHVPGRRWRVVPRGGNSDLAP